MHALFCRVNNLLQNRSAPCRPAFSAQVEKRQQDKGKPSTVLGPDVLEELAKQATPRDNPRTG